MKIKVRNDQTVNLLKSLKNNRVAVFIDAANLYHATSSVGIRVDFHQISKWFKDNLGESTELRFYSAYDPDNVKQIQFLDELTKCGYVVIKKPIKDFGSFIKGNMDIELAVDAISLKDSFDTLVLISGDGDFTYLVNALEKCYKKTAILSVGGYTSYELHLVADSYFFLDRIAQVWRPVKKVVNETTISTDDFQFAYHNPEVFETVSTPLKNQVNKVILKVD